MGIGQAARILDREFPDVSVSKLRYLESRGLITPTRTRGGTRQYTPDDIDRLRYILRCQQEEFLPLEVIAQRLTNAAPGPSAAPDDPASKNQSRSHVSNDSGTLAHLLRPRDTPGADTELTAAQFTRRSPASSGDIEQMRQHGLITRWDTTELAITEIIVRLRGYGIEPRHLRWLTQSADRITTLIDASLPSRPDASPLADAENDEERRRLASELIALQVLLVRNALQQP